jgi:hypothetical protein
MGVSLCSPDWPGTHNPSAAALSAGIADGRYPARLRPDVFKHLHQMLLLNKLGTVSRGFGENPVTLKADPPQWRWHLRPGMCWGQPAQDGSFPWHLRCGVFPPELFSQQESRT